MHTISEHLSNNNYEAVLDGLNKNNINSCHRGEFHSESEAIFSTFLVCYQSDDDLQNKIAVKCLHLLKRSCALGESFQNEIISKSNFLSILKKIFDSDTISKNIQMNCLQLLANLCVQNKPNQETVLGEFEDFLLESIRADCSYTNAATMIVYNAFIYKAAIRLNVQELLEVLLENVEVNRLAQKESPEFVSIFIQYLMCESNEIIEGYEQISFEKRILFLRYLIEYLRQDDRQSRPLHQDLFKHLLIDFKRKSDCVLKTVDTYLNRDITEEVFTLLLLISDASCVEPYGSFLRQDGGLFLNLGGLLRQLQSIGKKNDITIFTPVQNISEILQIRQGKSDLNIEQQISFCLKSALVKALANLSYRNKKNQHLAREMEILTAILDCTNLDARNPLIKEWSILAIRNLCEDNVENQKLIAALSKVSDAQNSLIAEYSSGGRIIRIKDNGLPPSQ